LWGDPGKSGKAGQRSAPKESMGKSVTAQSAKTLLIIPEQSSPSISHLSSPAPVPTITVSGDRCG